MAGALSLRALPGGPGDQAARAGEGRRRADLAATGARRLAAPARTGVQARPPGTPGARLVTALASRAGISQDAAMPTRLLQGEHARRGTRHAAVRPRARVRGRAGRPVRPPQTAPVTPAGPPRPAVPAGPRGRREAATSVAAPGPREATSVPPEGQAAAPGGPPTMTVHVTGGQRTAVRAGPLPGTGPAGRVGRAGHDPRPMMTTGATVAALPRGRHAGGANPPRAEDPPPATAVVTGQAGVQGGAATDGRAARPAAPGPRGRRRRPAVPGPTMRPGRRFPTRSTPISWIPRPGPSCTACRTTWPTA